IHIAIIMDLMGGVHWAPTRNVVFAAGAEQAPDFYRRVKESRASLFEVQSSSVERGTSHRIPLSPFCRSACTWSKRFRWSAVCSSATIMHSEIVACPFCFCHQDERLATINQQTSRTHCTTNAWQRLSSG